MSRLGYLLLGGILCATGVTGRAIAEDPLARFAPASTGTFDDEGNYRLSAEELRYDCPRVTGLMQVRLLQIRGHEKRETSTMLSRAFRAIATLFGGGDKGSEPDGRYERDRAVLRAFNGRLAEKKCRTFDLHAELRAQPVNRTPTPR